MDRLTKEQRRKNMQAVKSKGSKIENLLSKELWKRGHRYRKNNKTVYGKPDFTFKNIKLQYLLIVNFGMGKIGKPEKMITKAIKNFGTKKLNEISKETTK